MQDFNDYMKLTRGYLRDYRKMEARIKAWAQEKADLLRELSDVPIAISRYGGEPGGGSGDMNVVERQADNRIKLESRCKEIDDDTAELKRLMTKIENAVSSLEPETCQLVWEHYVDGIAWYGIADRLYLSSDCVRKRGQRALADIADILFGRKAQPYKPVVLIA